MKSELADCLKSECQVQIAPVQRGKRLQRTVRDSQWNSMYIALLWVQLSVSLNFWDYNSAFYCWFHVSVWLKYSSHLQFSLAMSFSLNNTGVTVVVVVKARRRCRHCASNSFIDSRVFKTTSICVSVNSSTTSRSFRPCRTLLVSLEILFAFSIFLAAMPAFFLILVYLHDYGHCEWITSSRMVGLREWNKYL